MMDWFKNNSDKLFLLVLFIIQLGVVVWMTAKMLPEGSVDWARDTANLVLGGLLGLITGNALRHPPPNPPPGPHP